MNFKKEPKRVILDYPQAQLFQLLYEGKIGEDSEVWYVSNIVTHFLNNTQDILPLVTEQQGLQLASRCFISTSFFRDYLEHLTQFHGNPSYRFYLQIGKREFDRCGKTNLAEHLDDWADYIHEKFKELLDYNAQLKIPQTYQQARFHKDYLI